MIFLEALMQGDFSRNTFDPTNHYLRVLMQQGRVQVDADWNEQTAILLHYMQSLARDIIGPHGGPGDSFRLAPRTGKPNDFMIGRGHYYVDGMLCENDATNGIAYTEQPDYPGVSADALGGRRHLVYLDVWERHLTYLQDADIREVALGVGVDTATRAQLLWQVKTHLLDNADITCANLDTSFEGEDTHWQNFVDQWQPPNRGLLKARAQVTDDMDVTNPCVLPPESRYRGAENQLYRVEIHHVDEDGSENGKAYIKWSRENASVVYPILAIAEKIVNVQHLGMDSRFTLQEGDWVEIVDDLTTLRNEPGPLRKVTAIDRVNLKVTLDRAPDGETGRDESRHPFLRRWDHRSRAGGPTVSEKGMVLAEGSGDSEWMALEDGIQIQFQPGATYRVGDYWLIPARTAIGDVLWPQDSTTGGPQTVPPHGITHHYAPLGIITFDPNGNVEGAIDDCRCRLISLCTISDVLRRSRNNDG